MSIKQLNELADNARSLRRTETSLKSQAAHVEVLRKRHADGALTAMVGTDEGNRGLRSKSDRLMMDADLVFAEVWKDHGDAMLEHVAMELRLRAQRTGAEAGLIEYKLAFLERAIGPVMEAETDEE